MPSTPSAVLGTFNLPVQWPLVITPPERTVTVVANALSAAPMQVNDFISNFGVISFTVVLEGIATEGETAADHLARLIGNLKTEIAKDTNTLTIQWANATASTAYHIYKSKPPTIEYDAPYGRANVAFVAVELNYLP